MTRASDASACGEVTDGRNRTCVSSERNIGNIIERRGHVGGWLRWRMIAPGAHWIKIGEKLCTQRWRVMAGESRGECLAVELARKGVRQILEENQRDQDTVTRRSNGRGLIGEHAELNRQVRALERNGSVYTGSIALKSKALIGRQLRQNAVRGRPEREHTLAAIVRNQAAAKNLRKLPRGVSAQRIHLKEAVLGGHEALREDEIVKALRVQRGEHPAGRDGRGPARPGRLEEWIPRPAAGCR